MTRDRVLLAQSQCIIELRRLVTANPDEPCFASARTALDTLAQLEREHAMRPVLWVVETGGDAA